MIILISNLIGLLFTFRLNKTEPELFWFNLLLTGVMAFLVGMFLCIPIGSLTKTKSWSKTSETPIASWREGDGVTGRFALGSGIVDNGSVLVAYHERGKGSFFPQRVIGRPGSIEIIEDSTIPPRVEVFTECPVLSKLGYWLCFPTSLIEDGPKRYFYKFTVPTGTIRDRL